MVKKFRSDELLECVTKLLEPLNVIIDVFVMILAAREYAADRVLDRECMQLQARSVLHIGTDRLEHLDWIVVQLGVEIGMALKLVK